MLNFDEILHFLHFLKTCEEHKSYIDSTPEVAYYRGNEIKSALSDTSQQDAQGHKIGASIMQPVTSTVPRSQLIEEVKRILRRFEASGLAIELACNLNQALQATHRNEQAYNAVLADFVASPLRFMNA